MWFAPPSSPRHHISHAKQNAPVKTKIERHAGTFDLRVKSKIQAKHASKLSQNDRLPMFEISFQWAL